MQAALPSFSNMRGFCLARVLAATRLTSLGPRDDCSEAKPSRDSAVACRGDEDLNVELATCSGLRHAETVSRE